MLARTVRTLLLGGLGLAAIAGAIPFSARAVAAQPAAKGAKASAPATGEMKTRDLRAESGGLKLRLVEKFRTGNEESWKQNGKVILLVHGATWASRCTFDPDPEHGYSLMETLADQGYDVFSVDLHGYGKSEASEEDATEAQTAWKDIDAAVEFIRSFRWVEKVHLLGYQWGSHPVLLYATQKPQKINRLVLLGARWKHVEFTGTIAPGPVRTLGQQASLLKPDDGDLDQEFVRRRAQVCRAESVQAPNGALRDLSRPSGIEPPKIKCPLLLIQGERDGSPEIVADRLNLLRDLGSREKWFVSLKGLGKYALVERNHQRFDQAVLSFLDQAAAQGSAPAAQP